MSPDQRLIDLRIAWLRQYAGESAGLDPALAPVVAGRLGQVDGYFSAVAAAVVIVGPSQADPALATADPRVGLIGLLPRVEAEFAGRLLIGPADARRWQSDPGPLSWALIGVDELDRLGPDPDFLRALFARGVRLFRAAGLSDPIRLITSLENLTPPPGEAGPRPIVDLEGLDAAGLDDAIAWWEADPARIARVLPLFAHAWPAPDLLGRLRAIGAVVALPVGPPAFAAPDDLRLAIETAAAIPFLGRPGPEGLAIATDFLGVDSTLSGLGSAGAVARWLRRNVDPPTAALLTSATARRLLLAAIGADPPA